MKAQNSTPQSILIHVAQEDIPEHEIDLWPSLRETLVSSQTFTQRGDLSMFTRRTSKTLKPNQLRFVIGTGLVLLILAAVFVLVPENQVLAEAWNRLFKVASSTEIPLANPQEAATPTIAPTFAATLASAAEVASNETPTPRLPGMPPDAFSSCEEDPYGYTCKMAWAEKRVGFDAKELPVVPDALRLDYIFVNENKVLTVAYSLIGGGGYFYIFQGLGSEVQSPSGGVPEDAIEEVQVGEYHGEFAAGNFVTTGDPPVYKWTSGGRSRLRWTDGERWYELDSMACVGPTFCPGRDELIQMASQLVSQPDSTEGLRANYLKSLEDASRLAGFDILAPTILPEGFSFGYASYDAEISQLRLNYYPPGGEEKGSAHLLVVETPIDRVQLSPDMNGEQIKGESVEINAQPGVYFSDSSFNHTVTWQNGGFKVTLSLYSSDLWYGGTFTKEQILEIAESIR